MNRDEAAAGALASWTAAVLCRFCARGPDPKAPEDWRTPKPRGVPAGSWRVHNIAFGGPTATLARMEKRDKPPVDSELKRRIEELITYKGGGHNPDLVADVVENALKRSEERRVGKKWS